ncbi:sulfite exporter TauE/SafE family protein [Actibacterium pelagium]|uniref:Probable membrane transporter protein n=1 Tax=Actibacterium pelagium TaxID=2029103 RepID=A0A917AN85_9RHOB|nr:sulfite exporter TauE/SafE family protein [Actibacterium pelagium]GGE61161.1 UPF0721 transmembrane protein [Actibacterium pelagium]
MIELSLILFLVSVPAVIFAGISKGGFGSAAAFVATPILALVIEPAAALVLLLPLLMLMDVASLRAYWQQWDTHAAKVLIIGAMPGVALGYLLFSLTHPDVLRFLIGLISVLFVLYRLAMSLNWLRPPARLPGTGLGLLAGAVSGFTSFISHAGGPAAAIYLLGRRLDKTAFQATTVIVFFVVNIAKLAPLVWSGSFDRSILLADLILAPVALIGVWLGVFAHHRISERNFFALTYVLLLVTGSKLIWDALT